MTSTDSAPLPEQEPPDIVDYWDYRQGYKQGYRHALDYMERFAVTQRVGTRKALQHCRDHEEILVLWSSIHRNDFADIPWIKEVVK